MTDGEEDYPPPLPRHRRPVSEPPDPGAFGEAPGYRDDDQSAPPWFDSVIDGVTSASSGAMPPNAPLDPSARIPAATEPEAGMGRPRMPGGMAGGAADQSPSSHSPSSSPPDTGRVSAVGGAPSMPTLPEGADGATERPGKAAGSGSSNVLDALRSGPIPVVGAVVALVAAAGLIGWLFRGTGGGEEITIGGDAADAGQGADGQGADGSDPADAAADLPPLSPATLPPVNEDGLVGIELALIDPYTGTGSTGTAELYLNALTGQICHLFDSPAMPGRYHAYVHEAEFPKAGPIVVDLGEVANSVPQCVNASPIDLSRALANVETFYVAAHADDREIVLRAQLSAGSTVFDNRDAALVASQEAAQAPAGSEGDGDGLFGSTDEGAYLVVESGRVSFEGMVPDQQTADQLRAAFIALSGMGVDVVDNMSVQAGAPAPSGKVIVADALLFGSGQDQISGDQAVLSTLADLMTVNPTWTMTITGHTDDVGPYSFNIELSLRRANNIRTRLAELGVPAERIRVQGAGPEQPIGDNSTDEGRSRNRRIEISIDS